jgi:hypothetical protein
MEKWVEGEGQERKVLMLVRLGVAYRAPLGYPSTLSILPPRHHPKTLTATFVPNLQKKTGNSPTLLKSRKRSINLKFL